VDSLAYPKAPVNIIYLYGGLLDEDPPFVTTSWG
jgi:hypothetical protein